MYLLAALHGIDASLLASDSLRRLRSAVRRVVWSRRQPLASVGAVLSLLDGSTGCDPAFCVVWFRFRLLRRYLALWPAEVGRVYRLLAMVHEGCRHALAWVRPGLPLLSNLAGPSQHFKAALLDACRNKVAADLCGRKGFRGGPLLDIHGSLQLLNSSHVRERDKALLRSIMVGGMVFFLVRFVVIPFLAGFVEPLIMMVNFFWECSFPPLVWIRENPEFHDLMRMDKTCWPRCLLWHGWLPMLSGVNGASPWAIDASESAAHLVEVALGRYSSGLIADWNPSDVFDHDMAVSSLPDHPDVWTDGSLVLDRLTGASFSGSRFFAHQAEHFWKSRRWGHVDGVRVNPDVASCTGFCSVPGPLQSVQRAETWGVILALQTSRAVHLGVDNLGVVRHVGRLLDGCRGPIPFEPVNDGDLLLLTERVLHRRGLDTVRISKVKGHADEDMVLHGRVRGEDKLGNDAADEAADFGRRRVCPAFIDVRRNLSGVCGLWYPTILDLHRFFHCCFSCCGQS